MTEGLQIEVLTSVYRMARGHPRPESVRSRLDQVAREEVARECTRAVAALLAPDDPSVWVIDRLDVQFALDVGAVESTQVAALWANRIAGSLARTVAAGPDESVGVRRFPNRAAYLAWLLGALLAGRPWTSLHTSEFEGLRTLPLAGLISEAFAREPAIAAAVLDALVAGGMIERLMRTLTPHSAGRILRVCAPDAAGSEVDRELWERALALSGAASSPLEVYLRCRLELPDAKAAAVRAAAERALELRVALGSAETREAMRRGDFSGALRAAAEEHRAALLLLYTLAAGDRERMRQFVGAVTPEHGDAKNAFDSAFGGVFLLLPDLIALFPEAGALARYTILLKCLGRDLAPAAWQDRALLLAAGLEEEPSREAIAGCGAPFELPAVPAEAGAHFSLDRILSSPEASDSLSRAAFALMGQFARRFLGLHESSAPYLVRNVIAGGARIVATPRRITVRIAPRPLQIVLRMAGIHRLRVLPPWLAEAETEIEIELSDD